MNPNIIVTKDINVPDDIPGIGHLYFERMKQHAKENKVFQVSPVYICITRNYFNVLLRSTPIQVKKIHTPQCFRGL